MTPFVRRAAGRNGCTLFASHPLIMETQMEKAPTTPAETHGLCLVVADRGFVWVGEVTTSDDWVSISKARAVRRWGTTEGLNELANKGPLPNTRLDAPAELKVSRKALIALIPCEQSRWAA